MAMNLGVGGPPKKKGAPPPPFGGNRGGSPAKAAPPSASGGDVDQRGAAEEIAEAPPAKAAPPVAAPPPPAATDDGGGIPPEAVCYRSEMETCGNCTYNEGGQCSKLQIPVGDGDGCNLFMDRGGGAGLEAGPAEAMEGEPPPAV